MPFRLVDVDALKPEEALLVLKAAYKGFNVLSTFYGPIEPYEDMICFTEAGIPKVWLNSNLASNSPEASRQANPLRQAQENRTQVYIRKIFDMVETKSEKRQLPSELKDIFRAENFKNFFEAYNSVDEYIVINNIPALTRIQFKGDQVEPAYLHSSSIRSSGPHFADESFVPSKALPRLNENPGDIKINRNLSVPIPSNAVSIPQAANTMQGSGITAVKTIPTYQTLSREAFHHPHSQPLPLSIHTFH